MSGDREGPSQPFGELGGLDLRALLGEVTERVEAVTALADRLQDLLRAVVAIGSHLELEEVLRTIAETAAELADARYAAIGVLDPSDENVLGNFVTVGIDDDTRAKIGPLPTGRGVLGLLIREPRAIRLADLGSHPSSYGYPPHHPPMTSFLGVPISVRGEAFGNIYLTDKRSQPEFTAQDEQVVLALAAAAGLAVQNARLYARSHQREMWLEASAAITTQLLEGAPPSEVLPEIARHGLVLADADLAYIALREDGGARVTAAVGRNADELLNVLLPATSVTAGVAREGSPMAIVNAGQDERVWPGLQATGVGSVLYVPLGGAEAALGTLVVGRDQTKSRFDEGVLQILQSFAGQAAIALQLGESARAREQLAVLEDRDRIGRDLHDLVIQRLFATGMVLEGTLRGLQPPEKAARVRQAVDDLDATIREIRTSIFALQEPAPQAGEGVRVAVLGAVRMASSALGFEPELRLDGPIDTLVPGHVAEQLLAVLREALSNVVKHAEASRVWVEVAAETDKVTLDVRDDGRGLPATGRRSGLANLEARARALGGTCIVGCPEDRGTQVCWSVPL